MVCKHGLDEINCPICRISTSTRPLNDLNSDIVNINPLKTENPFFKKYFCTPFCNASCCISTCF